MEDDLEHKRAMVLGLAFDCPLCDVHSNCPLNQIRHNSNPLEKHRHVKGLSVEAIEAIYSHHQSCLQERELRRILNEQLKRGAPSSKGR